MNIYNTALNRLRKGDVLYLEYYTENKYKQVFSGVCIKIYGDKKNKRIKVFNVEQKLTSIFFLNSPNIIIIKVL
jgi:hypothetical protein